MSDIDAVIRLSKYAEHQLKTRYGAEGKGLKEQLISVQDVIPLEMRDHLSFLAHVRNSLAHDYGSDQLLNPGRFNQTRYAVLQFFAAAETEAPELNEPAGLSVAWRVLGLFKITQSKLFSALARGRWPITISSFFGSLLVLFLMGDLVNQVADGMSPLSFVSDMQKLAQISLLIAIGVFVLLSERVVRVLLALLDLFVIFFTMSFLMLLGWGALRLMMPA